MHWFKIREQGGTSSAFSPSASNDCVEGQLPYGCGIHVFLLSLACLADRFFSWLLSSLEFCFYVCLLIILSGLSDYVVGIKRYEKT